MTRNKLKIKNKKANLITAAYLIAGFISEVTRVVLGII